MLPKFLYKEVEVIIHLDIIRIIKNSLYHQEKGKLMSFCQELIGFMFLQCEGIYLWRETTSKLVLSSLQRIQILQRTAPQPQQLPLSPNFSYLFHLISKPQFTQVSFFCQLLQGKKCILLIESQTQYLVLKHAKKQRSV